MSTTLKKYPTVGVCGLDCGLCPRYYTSGPSRCPGCCGPDFTNKHPSCSFITCCVKKRNLEVCGECQDFPCDKFKSAEEYDHVTESSSYPSYKKALPNLYFIRENGIEKFIGQQEKRIKLLAVMIKNFDDGRSRSFYCKAAIFFDPSILERSISTALHIIETEKVEPDDLKRKAKIFRTMIEGNLPKS